MSSVAVVIPTFNKAPYLALTLATLANQDSSDFLTVIVDDGSEDDTREVVERFQPRLRLEYLRQENAGRSAARNRGLRACQGKTILFCDDDRLLPPQYVSQHLAAMGVRDNVVVVGRKRAVLSRWIPEVLPINPRQIDILRQRHGKDLDLLVKSPAQQLIMESNLLTQWDESIRRWDLGDEADNFMAAQVTTSGSCNSPLSWLYVTTANMSVRCHELGRSILFDEGFQGWGVEDTDMGYQLFRAGLAFEFDSSIMNYHQIHSTGPASAGENDTIRRTQLARNFGRFCMKWGEFEPYLAAATYGRLPPETILQIARQAAAAHGTPLVQELQLMYAQVVESSLSQAQKAN